MTRTHRHPVGDLLSRCHLGTLSAARIVSEVAGAPTAGLAARSSDELGDEIAGRWKQLTGRSIHADEHAVLVVERDRQGRVIRHQVEGVAASW